jgi:hypothetical protein
MTNAKKPEESDLTRREALKRLGLAVGAVYMTPMLLSLSNAQASSTSSGGGDDNSGSGSDNSGSGSDNSGSDSDNSGSGSENSGSGSGGTSSASSVSSASTPSSPGEDNEFSGDPTPAGGNLSSDEELWLIQNGWQKAAHK